MTNDQITAEITKLKRRLNELRGEQESRRINKLELDCDNRRRVVKYAFFTGYRYRFGETTYFVTHANRYGEHKIMKGKAVIVKNERRPMAKLSELFGHSAYNAPLIDR